MTFPIKKRINTKLFIDRNKGVYDILPYAELPQLTIVSSPCFVLHFGVKLIDCDCKVDLVSGGLGWAPCNRIGILSYSWGWVGGWGNQPLGRISGIFLCTKNTRLLNLHENFRVVKESSYMIYLKAILPLWCFVTEITLWKYLISIQVTLVWDSKKPTKYNLTRFEPPMIWKDFPIKTFRAKNVLGCTTKGFNLIHIKKMRNLKHFERKIHFRRTKKEKNFFHSTEPQTRNF